MTEDELVGWHHRLNGHEFEWTPGVGDRQGGVACCSTWGRKESDMTEQLNWMNWIIVTLLVRTQKRRVTLCSILCSNTRSFKAQEESEGQLALDSYENISYAIVTWYPWTLIFYLICLKLDLSEVNELKGKQILNCGLWPRGKYQFITTATEWVWVQGPLAAVEQLLMSYGMEY